MKSLILASFAVATILFQPNLAHARDRSDYCLNYPDDPECEVSKVPDYCDERPYDKGCEGVAVRPRPPRPWDCDARPYDKGCELVIVRPRNRCERIAADLRDRGYRRVRAVECGGKNYKYTAWKRGQSVLIKVKASTGRIIYVIAN